MATFGVIAARSNRCRVIEAMQAGEMACGHSRCGNGCSLTKKRPEGVKRLHPPARLTRTHEELVALHLETKKQEAARYLATHKKYSKGTPARRP